MSKTPFANQKKVWLSVKLLWENSKENIHKQLVYTMGKLEQIIGKFKIDGVHICIGNDVI